MKKYIVNATLQGVIPKGTKNNIEYVKKLFKDEYNIIILDDEIVIEEVLE